MILILRRFLNLWRFLPFVFPNSHCIGPVARPVMNTSSVPAQRVSKCMLYCLGCLFARYIILDIRIHNCGKSLLLYWQLGRRYYEHWFYCHIPIFQNNIPHYIHSPSNPSILSHCIQDYLIPPPGTSNIFMHLHQVSVPKSHLQMCL